MRLLAPYFIAAAVSLSAPAPGLNSERVLEMIAQVEGHKATDLGGRYGISRGVWRDNTRMSYALSRQPEHADAIARKHLNWLVEQLGAAASPWSIAASWRWGLDGYRAKLARRERIEYADRVFQLYHAQ